MHVIHADNVREAWERGMRHLWQVGEWSSSRAGRVLVAPTPVTTVYEHPTRRVLTDPVRDQNPFFTLAESLWMLAGRRDVAFLNRFVADFGERFGEADGTEHDAYGHRWRRHFGLDQLNEVVWRLRRDPSDRQCVVQMWDATPRHSVEQSGTDNVGDRADGSRIYAGANDLLGAWKTRPCNTHAYLRVRSPRAELDLTVLCRSNDMIFGGYGANAVHFSVLQEYLAARIGVSVGRMYQVSNNFHAYEEVLEQKFPRSRTDPIGIAEAIKYREQPRALVDDPRIFDDECRYLLEMVDQDYLLKPITPDVSFFKNKFLSQTARHMMHAHAQWRLGRRDCAISIVERVEAEDWRRAGLEWFLRRIDTGPVVQRNRKLIQGESN